MALKEDDRLPLRETGDGSFTFYSPTFGETFHSLDGAHQEAVQKFVDPCRLSHWAAQQAEVHLLDVCYGLGYNSAAALTRIWSINPHCRVQLYALEWDVSVPCLAIAHDGLAPYPLIVQQSLQDLAYHGQVKTDLLTATLAIGDARQTVKALPPHWQAEAIFLDPFSPPKCPQLWTVEFFQALGDRLAPQGCLSTYSSAAAVRHGLQLAGLHIASLPDSQPPNPHRRPLGTLASHHPLTLPPFTPWEQEHLQTKAAIPYRDPQGQDPPDVIRARRQAEQAHSPAEPANRWKKRWLARP